MRGRNGLQHEITNTHDMHRSRREHHGNKRKSLHTRHNSTFAVAQYIFLSRYARKENKSDKVNQTCLLKSNQLNTFMRLIFTHIRTYMMHT